MSIITRGYGTNSRLITQGYGKELVIVIPVPEIIRPKKKYGGGGYIPSTFESAWDWLIKTKPIRISLFRKEIFVKVTREDSVEVNVELNFTKYDRIKVIFKGTEK